ncbi:hypothetical protein HXA34_15155 [Salipaludibacillus agaradhaerens]|jgi:hypothetical protein|uniref:Uncharacterized protein n=1 Tax=Salipaludibacillus agaradhaerens TaxID=76935 RepID=A0A9Q4AZT4_SALAG|nr:hypothetical protein [Salipaludibacillus agaradhaerens]UJW58683.1 hypothetical protein HXZ66_15280 [Bacillus sp. A116_S68]MCR6095471.1 hypothetical protein [Salipaludibacillus agaradhaerens]MCR6107643.1 hypothetical protein [Salipaludibacillus agaradhaerens]MCR6114969.1 hypothetical protein [Salipaludibacillus agaradhaerens]MCR6119672.1 hypothetical protein [Salipaludibacillus agaradhaerens]
MAREELLKDVQTLLYELKETPILKNQTIFRLNETIKELRNMELNPNFTGTIQEIHIFADKVITSSHPNDVVHHHSLNIARWIEEVGLLINGGGKVTIDYEQRKGREV